jgi:hypothetical protein
MNFSDTHQHLFNNGSAPLMMASIFKRTSLPILKRKKILAGAKKIFFYIQLSSKWHFLKPADSS